MLMMNFIKNSTRNCRRKLATLGSLKGGESQPNLNFNLMRNLEIYHLKIYIYTSIYMYIHIAQMNL